MSCPRTQHNVPGQGPFLERPGNLPGPESDFYIKVSRKVGCVLTSDEVHFVSLADNFTVQLSNFLKLPLEWKTKQLNGPGNYRELRETGPRARTQTALSGDEPTNHEATVPEIVRILAIILLRHLVFIRIRPHWEHMSIFLPLSMTFEWHLLQPK